jgi:hypothetical protein
MMGFCKSGNELLSFIKKKKLLGERYNKFVKPRTGLFVSAKNASIKG